MEATKFGHSAKYGRASRPLNAFGRWCADRGLDAGELDKALGVGTNTGYHYIRPLDHPRFHMPPAAVMKRIFLLTEGAITPLDFYDVDAWRKALAEKAAA